LSQVHSQLALQLEQQQQHRLAPLPGSMYSNKQYQQQDRRDLQLQQKQLMLMASLAYP
jgi:hypothetical protein